MVGGGPFGLEAGEWTDDTSMALALSDSLLEHGGLNETDLMDRFLAWKNHGRYSCTGSCFDIGVTTAGALNRYEESGNPVAGSTDPKRAGNGSLMRLAPVVLHGLSCSEGYIAEIARRQSATTHASAECVDACEQFARMLFAIISNEGTGRTPAANTPAISAVINGSWRTKGRDEIRSTGYVVDTMEAAVWAVARTRSFRDALVLAVNLGGDADTVGAVTGQLAGARYGLSSIPEIWLERLAWRQRIEKIGLELLHLNSPAAHSAFLDSLQVRTVPDVVANVGVVAH